MFRCRHSCDVVAVVVIYSEDELGEPWKRTDDVTPRVTNETTLCCFNAIVARQQRSTSKRGGGMQRKSAFGPERNQAIKEQLSNTRSQQVVSTGPRRPVPGSGGGLDYPVSQ